MRLFGEFQTADQPLFTRDRHGQSQTYWKARRAGAKDGGDYFIKSIALRSTGPAQNALDAAPPTDLAADFFESVARLNKAYVADPELLAPIHAFGRTDAELWYATDYYRRESLARFFATGADINDASLGHVVYSLASACLALQRATGWSHGNLKASNVLLGGKPGPLGLTQLRVIDVAGSTSLWGSTEKPHTPVPSLATGESERALRRWAELRDLRAIGGIILTVVESNPIEGPDDYTLPIQPSVPWRALGEQARHWLDLCNRLLDPNLSLDEITLESLINEFEPTRQRNWAPAIVVGFSLALIAGIASYALWSRPRSQTTITAAPPQTAPFAQRLASNRTDNSVPLAQGSPRTETPSLAKTRNSPAMEGEADKQVADSPRRLPNAAQRVASLPREPNTNAALADLSQAARTTETGRLPAVGGPSTNPSPAPILRAEAHADGASAPSSAGRSAASATGTIQTETGQAEGRTQSAVSEPQVGMPRGSSMSSFDRTDIPARETQPSTRAPSPPSAAQIDVGQLDEQLHKLEAEVARLVVLRRNSELFTRVNSLEAQYARAHQLSEKTRKRFHLLRTNMANKLPTASPRGLINDPGSPPRLGQ